MTKTYPITEEQFTEAKVLIRRNGGTIEADNSFEIQGVEGQFEKDADSLTITIAKKPLFATWDRIEKTLDGFFAEIK